jgi:catechol 2,3-dioxygenase-like lactoylglutathione lyase family enzyme
MAQTVTPQFRITDARRSTLFYVDGLGFKIDWEHRFEPGFPVFMSLTRAGQTIFSPSTPATAKSVGQRILSSLM